MTNQSLVYLSQVASSAVALFLGILTWAKTRDAKWILLIVAALAIYLMAIVEYLQLFSASSALGLAVRLLLSNTPPLLIGLIFFLYVRKQSRR